MTRTSLTSRQIRVQVRPRLPGDLTACVDVLRSVHIADGYPAVWPTHPEKWIAPEKEQFAWVAVDVTGAVQGHIALHAASDHDACDLWSKSSGLSPELIIAVARLFVAPCLRRHGIGRTLLDTATERAWALGLQPVLDVGQRNVAAARFYDELGWRRVGRLDSRQIPILAYIGPVKAPIAAAR